MPNTSAPAQLKFIKENLEIIEKIGILSLRALSRAAAGLITPFARWWQVQHQDGGGGEGRATVGCWGDTTASHYQADQKLEKLKLSLAFTGVSQI